MSTPRNMPASVHQRLLNLARERHEELQSLLTRYALERLLYRLSRSRYRDQVVLKGALLVIVWTGQPHRATRDLDLSGSGEPVIHRFEAIFRELCATPVADDGLEFVAETIRALPIRDDQEYEGLRVHLTARLGQARLPLQVDIGFGDAIIPAPVDVVLPVLLDGPAPQLRAYPRETVVAEKFQAMVMLGIANSRMKDFYDIWTLAQRFTFDGAILCRACAATFARRRTPLPTDTPLALTPAFSNDAGKQTQWRAFVRRGRLADGEVDFTEVVTLVSNFLMPPMHALAAGQSFTQHWPVGGPWQPGEEEHDG